ncbi:hypothetical protein COI_1887 [Mannheimia haemolytica serotype A2 str. OVINE]|nr:hypothetical protein COI_1887 [Mannheimia haemolytica serotype A2 str. OVINE]
MHPQKLNHSEVIFHLLTSKKVNLSEILLLSLKVVFSQNSFHEILDKKLEIEFS